MLLLLVVLAVAVAVAVAAAPPSRFSFVYYYADHYKYESMTHLFPLDACSLYRLRSMSARKKRKVRKKDARIVKYVITCTLVTSDE